MSSYLLHPPPLNGCLSKMSNPKIDSQVAYIEVITYCGNGFFFNKNKKRKIESHFDEASKRVNCLTSVQCNDDYISHVRN